MIQSNKKHLDGDSISETIICEKKQTFTLLKNLRLRNRLIYFTQVFMEKTLFSNFSVHEWPSGTNQIRKPSYLALYFLFGFYEIQKLLQKGMSILNIKQYMRQFNYYIQCIRTIKLIHNTVQNFLNSFILKIL